MIILLILERKGPAHCPALILGYRNAVQKELLQFAFYSL